MILYALGIKFPAASSGVLLHRDSHASRLGSVLRSALTDTANIFYAASDGESDPKRLISLLSLAIVIRSPDSTAIYFAHVALQHHPTPELIDFVLTNLDGCNEPPHPTDEPADMDDEPLVDRTFA